MVTFKNFGNWSLTYFQHGCHWELYWSNGLAGNWQAAAESMKILVDGSFWSPAVINYLYAIVLVSTPAVIFVLDNKNVFS